MNCILLHLYNLKFVYTFFLCWILYSIWMDPDRPVHGPVFTCSVGWMFLLYTLIDHPLYSSLKKWLILYYPRTLVLAVVVHKQHSAISTQKDYFPLYRVSSTSVADHNCCRRSRYMWPIRSSAEIMSSGGHIHKGNSFVKAQVNAVSETIYVFSEVTRFLQVTEPRKHTACCQPLHLLWHQYRQKGNTKNA